MREQEELELALKSVLAPEPAPEGFALRVMTRLEGGASSTSATTARYITDQSAHFAWVVVPYSEKSKRPSFRRRLVSLFYRKGNDTQELGLLSSRNASFENKAWQPLFSAMAHALVLVIAVLLIEHRGPRILTKAQQQESFAEIEVSPLNLPIGKHPMSGGGGGGAHQTSPPTAGKPPITRKTPIPVQSLNAQLDPKLAVEPSVALPIMVMPPSQPLEAGVPLGQMLSSSVPSAGPGAEGGIGSGVESGLGGGKGPGIGPGENGGYGGGIYHVGGGVSAPILIHWVDPEFSDEARRAKFQGISEVAVVVDKDGMPTDIRLARSLGMGLDEKAIEAVKQYRFRPAMFQGKPVAVAITVQVNFHIY